MIPVLTALHALSAVVWVGGMVFAFMVLRPTVDTLDVPTKMTVLAGIFRRFFIWVWHAVVILPATGYALMFTTFGGFAGSAPYIHIMQGISWIMTALFLFLFFGPYPPFRKAVVAADWPQAAVHLPLIRRLIAVNLVLGIITVALGAGGRYWG